MIPDANAFARSSIPIGDSASITSFKSPRSFRPDSVRKWLHAKPTASSIICCGVCGFIGLGGTNCGQSSRSTLQRAAPSAMYSENRSRPRLTRPTPIDPRGCEWNTFCELFNIDSSLQIIGLAELTNTLTIAYSTIQV